MCDISGRKQALSCMMQSLALDLSRAADTINVTHNEQLVKTVTKKHTSVKSGQMQCLWGGVSSFLTAHQHIIGCISALQWCEYCDKSVKI